jgi:hypothetical protein
MTPAYTQEDNADDDNKCIVPDVVLGGAGGGTTGPLFRVAPKISEIFQELRNEHPEAYESVLKKISSFDEGVKSDFEFVFGTQVDGNMVRFDAERALRQQYQNRLEFVQNLNKIQRVNERALILHDSGLSGYDKLSPGLINSLTRQNEEIEEILNDQLMSR